MDKSSQIVIPLPIKEAKKHLNAKVNEELFSAFTDEAKKAGISIRSALEWGMIKYVLTRNPSLAEKFERFILGKQK